MIVAAVDTETTGVPDVAEAAGLPPREIVEFGYCVYDTEAKQPLAGGYDLFEVDVWDDMAEEASTKKHHITKAHTEIAGAKPGSFDPQRILQYKPRIILAHNAAYDHPFVTSCWPELGQVEWLCTWRDIDHSKVIDDTSSHRLMHLAIEYGFPIVGWHRAYNDAEMVCRIASEHNLEEALIMKRLPKYLVETFGSYNDQMRMKLKEFRFRYAGKGEREGWPRGVWWNDNITEADLPMVKAAIAGLAPDWSTRFTEVVPTY